MINFTPPPTSSKSCELTVSPGQIYSSLSSGLSWTHVPSRVAVRKIHTVVTITISTASRILKYKQLLITDIQCMPQHELAIVLVQLVLACRYSYAMYLHIACTHTCTCVYTCHVHACTYLHHMYIYAVPTYTCALHVHMYTCTYVPEKATA